MKLTGGEDRCRESGKKLHLQVDMCRTCSEEFHSSNRKTRLASFENSPLFCLGRDRDVRISFFFFLSQISVPTLEMSSCENVLAGFCAIRLALERKLLGDSSLGGIDEPMAPRSEGSLLYQRNKGRRPSFSGLPCYAFN